MKFLSTSDASVRISLKEAVLNNSDKGGLYLPAAVPRLSESAVRKIRGACSFRDAAREVLMPFLSDDLPEPEIDSVCLRAFPFEAPIIPLDNNVSILELFHGPSLAFKDFGVRFMAELLETYLSGASQRHTILTATSGDTGGAVAAAFADREPFDVFILYPRGKVTEFQEKQISGHGKNITAIELDGTFDDCQRIVKAILDDGDIRKKRSFISANSINIGRLLPQICYYAKAAFSVSEKHRPLVVSVPSGNFGNLTAGILAKRMGAPIEHFIAATNRNDVVPRYLASGKYEPSPFVETLSNAMDIADPSNFARIRSLHGDSLDSIRSDLSGQAFSDDETKRAVAELLEKYRYLSEPHAAVAYLGLLGALRSRPDAIGIFLGTAHPVKFSEIVEEITGRAPPMPGGINLPDRIRSIKVGNRYEDVRALL